MKIAIVNDMPMAVEALRRALAFEPAHEVVWVAGNGAEAVQRCAENTPDLILMDLIMPVMDGIEATRRIMADTPCAIVIVTVDRQQNVHRVFEAMGHGALDVVDTPALGAGNAQEAAAPLLRKIMNIGWLIGDKGNRERSAPSPLRSSASRQRLIAIGSSAGGPAALEVLLKGLPRDFSAAIVLVQHVDQVFAAGMAEWLSSASGLKVRPGSGRRASFGRHSVAGGHQPPYSLAEKRHAGLYRRTGQRDLSALDRRVFRERGQLLEWRCRGRIAHRHGTRRRAGA
ncbi:two-component system response regulator WspF [Pseudomonas silensiensis]|nr:two-component system response regulator WspF [Pseudomonas silensiensis]